MRAKYAFFVGALVLSLPAQAATIVLESDIWCPYTCAVAGDRPGYMVEIARAVFEPLGHTVEYRVIPWPRAVENVRNGSADGAIGATLDDVKDTLLLPAEPLGRSKNVFVTAKGSPWTYSGPDSLSGRKLGTIRGYNYGDALESWIKAHHDRVEEAAGDAPLDANLKKVASNRVDATIDDAAVMAFTIARLGLGNQLREAGSDATVSDLYIAFTKAKPEGAVYARQLSEGIAALRSQGKLAAILGRYGLKDWK
jgi:polar amino acid transport system substrate-binding protein